MKRIFSLTLAVLMLLSFVACGKSSETKWQEQYDLGVRYLSEGNYEEAIIAFNAAIEIDPKQGEPYLNLVYIYSNQGNSGSALEVLRLAVSVIENSDGLTAEQLSDGRFRFLERTTSGEKKCDIYFDKEGVLRQEFYYENGRLIKECAYNDEAIWNPDIHEFSYSGKKVSIMISLTDEKGTVSDSYIYAMDSEENHIYLEGWGGDTTIGEITYLGVIEVTPDGMEYPTFMLVDE